MPWQWGKEGLKCVPPKTKGRHMICEVAMSWESYPHTKKSGTASGEERRCGSWGNEDLWRINCQRGWISSTSENTYRFCQTCLHSSRASRFTNRKLLVWLHLTLKLLTEELAPKSNKVQSRRVRGEEYEFRFLLQGTKWQKTPFPNYLRLQHWAQYGARHLH